MAYSGKKYLEKEYDMPRYRRMKRIRQVLVVGSILSLCSSLLLGTVKLFGNAFQEVDVDSLPEVTSAESKLEAQARGYELVLEREPENQIALEGLANVRIEMNDLNGAVAPLEKLVKITGQHSDYKAELDRLQQQIEQQK